MMINKNIIFVLICGFQITNIKTSDLTRVSVRLHALYPDKDLRSDGEKSLKKIESDVIAIKNKAKARIEVKVHPVDDLARFISPGSSMPEFYYNETQAAADKLAAKIASDAHKRREWFNRYTSAE